MPLKRFISNLDLYIFVPVIMISLAVFRGGREVLGLAVYFLLSVLFIFYFVKRENAVFSRTALDLPIIIFLSIVAVSGITALFANARTIVHLFGIVLVFALYYAMVSLKKDDGRLKRVLMLYIGLCFALSLVVCVQGLFGWQSFVASTSLPKAHFPNHNLLAGFIAPGVVIAICLIASKYGESRLARIFLLLSLLCMIAAQLFMFSRGAWLAILAGLLFVSFVNFRKLIMPGLVFTAICLFMFIVLPKPFLAKWVHHKFATDVGSSRKVIWTAALNAVKTRPFFGWGLGNFAYAYNRSQSPAEWEIGRYGHYTRFAHNEYLDVAAEEGMVGLAALLFLVFMIVKEGIRSVKNAGENYWLVVSCVAGAVAILTHCIFDFCLHLPLILFLLIFFISNFVSVENQIIIKRRTAGPVKTLLAASMILIVLASSSFVFAAMGAKNLDANFNKAMSLYTAAIFLNPLNSDFWIKRAENEPVYEKREAFYKDAISVDKNNEQISIALARHYLEVDNVADAVKMYKKSIELAPFNPFFYAELGDVHFFMNQYDDSLICYRKAVQLEPFYIYPLARLAELACLGGRMKECIGYINVVKVIKNLKLNPASAYDRRIIDQSGVKDTIESLCRNMDKNNAQK